MHPFLGTGVALVTPFDENLEIDFQGLTTILDRIAQSNVTYLVVHGTTGENATTTPAEKIALLQHIQAHNPKKLPIVYGLGGNNTSALLATLQQTTWHGIDAVLSVSPYYNKPAQAGIYAHYQAIASACPVPVILYNVPSRTGSTIQVATALALSQHPNILGIKDASGDLIQGMELLRQKSADFLVIAGDDALTVPLMAMGAVGVISVLANALPEQVSTMVTAALQGDYTTAREHTWRLLPLAQAISQAGNPVGTKQLLAALQLCKRYVRLPLVDDPGAWEERFVKLVPGLSGI